jgi:2-amino-4-hydroxy-6-hydroxymethyldihydropteridine diphosphokinase
MSALWVPAYVAIGSNLNQPADQVRNAFDALAMLPKTRVLSHSRLYRSAPLGPKDQPEFVNAAAGLLTQLSARQLLVELKELEQKLGRDVPVLRWGPRLIDLDLLVYGTERINETDLTVPHPGVPVRNFVLYPLQDIAAELNIPGYGSVAQLAARVGDAGLVPLS